MSNKSQNKIDTDTLLTGCLCLTAICFCFFVVITILFPRGGMLKEEPSDVVLEFLDKYMSTNSNIEEEAIVETYFSCVDKSDIDHYGRSQVLRDINSVFLKERSNAVGYKICKCSHGYIELMLLDLDGNELPPRIGILYKIGSDSKIGSFTVFRLQPLLNSHPEWRGIWQ